MARKFARRSRTAQRFRRNAHSDVHIRINSESNIDSRMMKRSLLCFVVTLCAVSWVRADQAIRSLQQTLKRQGFYYGTVTGDKNAETTAAIRRFQIRNGLQITGEINEETLRLVNPGSNAVASASPSPSKLASIQPDSARPDASAGLSQSSPPTSSNQPDRPLETNPPTRPAFINPRRFGWTVGPSRERSTN